MYANGICVGQDYSESAKWYLKAAENGNKKEAQYNLAMLFLKGKGVKQDTTVAAKWFRAAAEQGLAFAMFGLGVLYFEGNGVPQDVIEAAKWFRAAAEHGHPSAMAYYKALQNVHDHDADDSANPVIEMDPPTIVFD